MPIHSLIILASFSLLGISLLAQGFLLRNKSKSWLGKPPIENIYFISGKIALFASWTLFILKAIMPKMGYIEVPPALSWVGAVIMFIGSMIMALSFFSLGTSLKVGLPEEKTVLMTNGMYSFSRNPLYLGVFLITIASCLYFPDLLNIACAIYGINIHYRITLGEEKFLDDRFGESWREYKSRVRRYL